MNDEVNIPLLRKMVEWVEEQSKQSKATRQWMQSDWVVPERVRVTAYDHKQGCGTAYCAAGYVAAMVDVRFETGPYVKNENGDVLTASVVAEEALGIGRYGHGLWNAGNTAKDIREIAENLAGGPL